MNTTYEMLEMKEIITMLKENAVTAKVKQQLENLTPILSEQELKLRMKETSEARILLDTYGIPPISSADQIKKILEAAERGELLSIEELEEVRQFAVSCMRIIRYLKKSKDSFLSLSVYADGIQDLDCLKEEIERCIRNGAVDDYASKELREIRRKIAYTSTGIRQKLETILKSKKEYFSESFISNRNGHDTLPVKKEYKFQVTGTVIDISSSGATYFIEPSSIAKLKEELNELEIAQSNEERKIRYQLTAFVSEFEKEIDLNLSYLETLDYMFAKAKLSAKMDAKEPKINTKRQFYLKEGRHPLLPKETCIPLSIKFGYENSGIVITGPNTGGKTVALKTVGLCSVMAQCGLHIPAKEADICMNSQVLCDIGDGQSILENLSTFSAHIKSIIKITEAMDFESLILLDELGSGTDPTEGMGIAIAVLEELKKCGCNFIVTTHYPEIKEYAEQTKGMINARMAFDKESLKPLYHLELGEAGESCALYIAKRLGMPEHMLKRAKIAVEKKESIKEENKIEDEGDKTKKNRIKENKNKLKKDNQISKIKKIQSKKTINSRASIFQMGDSVMVYPQKEIGIVFCSANEYGEVGVQIKKRKQWINHKRLKLQVSAKEMYPEDYDYSIIFDSVEVRKAKHQMSRKYVKGLSIQTDLEGENKKI